MNFTRKQDAKVYILAHGGAESAFRKHLLLWEALGYEMELVVPEDDPIECDIPTSAVGKAQRIGHDSLKRIRFILSKIPTQRQPYGMLFQYDSFLRKRVTLQNGLSGIVRLFYKFPFVQTPRIAFYPLVIDQSSASEMLTKALKYPGFRNQGADTGYISSLAEMCGIPRLQFEEGDGVHARTLTTEDIDGKGDPVGFNGVKSPEVTDKILKLYDCFGIPHEDDGTSAESSTERAGEDETVDQEPGETGLEGPDLPRPTE